MRFLPVAALMAITCAGCNDPVDQSAATGDGTRIESNTQARFGELNIAVGNIWDAEDSPADEETRRGLTAGLWLHVDGAQDLYLRAHPGQRITALGHEVDVLAVEEHAVRVTVEPRLDGSRNDVRARNDADVLPDIEFSNATPGDWEFLVGKVEQTVAGTTQRRPISYRFEIAEPAQPREAAVEISWSNDDDAREWGRFSVPTNPQLPLEEYLQLLSGPLGEGRIIDVSPEVRRIGDKSYSCRRVERLNETAEGLHATTLWLSAEAPAARIVAYRSHWEPFPESADRAPETVLEVELFAYGNNHGQLWPH